VPIVIIGSTTVDTVELTVVVVPLTVRSPVKTKLPPTFKFPVKPRPPTILKDPVDVVVELVPLPNITSLFGTTNNEDVTDIPLPE
jgi:hypothetical protein